MASGQQHPVRAHPIGGDDEQRPWTIDDPARVVVLPTEMADAPRRSVGVTLRRVLRLVAESSGERERGAIRRPLERLDLLGERDQRAHLPAEADGGYEQLRAGLFAMTGEREEPTVGRPTGAAIALRSRG